MPRFRTSFSHGVMYCSVVALAVLAASPAAARIGSVVTTGSTVTPTALPVLGPAAPTGLAVTARTPSSITISWQPSASVTASGYGVYRDGTSAGSTSSTSYSFTGLACGTSYVLGVDTVDLIGNRSEPATISSATAACPDSQAPTAPTRLVAGTRTANSIALSWTASSDNTGVAGYGRYLGSQLASNGAGTSFTYAGLTCGTSYTLSVDAYDAAGNRSPRSTLTASTSACSDTQAPTGPANLTVVSSSSTSISLAWSASLDDTAVAGYALYKDSSFDGATQSTGYTFSGLACGNSYTLAVDAYDTAGNRSARSSIAASTGACSDTSAPTAPTGLAASGQTQTAITLTWSASSDNVGVTGYGRYRNGSLVSNGTGTSFTFSGLVCGTSYTLGVDGYDAAGNRSARSSATATTAACSAPPPPPPPSGSAHVWVDPNGGSCVRQSTAGSYADAQACGNLQAAYNAAAAGDTVGIAAGTYPGQTLSGTKAVTFQGAASRPSFGHVVSAASNITVRGILIEDRSDQSGPCSTASWGVLVPCGANQTFDNVIVDGLNTGDKHGIESPGDGLVFKNGEIRNILNMKGFEGGADDMVIENNYWHAITVNDSAVHNECMFVNGGNRSVYRGNLFVGCPTMALFFTNWNGGPAYRDVLVENNVFGHTLDASGGWHASCAFKIGWGYNNQNTVFGWIVRYNTFETDPCTDGTPSGSDARAAQWYGNLGGVLCAAEFVYRYNVGETCGGTGEVSVPNAVNSRGNPNAAPFYVNAPAGDFHLRSGAAPINRGDPGSYPATDRDGRGRSGAPDAGAYEFGS